MNSLGIEGLAGEFLGAPDSAASEKRVLDVMRERGMNANVSSDTGPASAVGETFSEALRHSVAKVNDLQSQADTAIRELVAGKTKNVHETLLAVERADASLKLMMQVRNKVLDAYREIMRMQV